MQAETKKTHERLSSIEQMKGRKIRSVSRTKYHDGQMYRQKVTVRFAGGSFIEFESGHVGGYLGSRGTYTISVV